MAEFSVKKREQIIAVIIVLRLTELKLRKYSYQELEGHKIRLARVSKAQKELRSEKTNPNTMNNDM